MKTYLVKETKVVTHTYLVNANNIHDALTEANANLSGISESPYGKVDTVVGFPVIDSIQLMEKN